MKIQIFKKGIFYFLTGLLIIAFSSCDRDDLLEKTPVTDLVEENGIQTEDDIASLTNACYDVLQWQVINGASTHMYPVMFQDIRADNCLSQWASYWTFGIVFDDFTRIQPNNTNIAAMWTKWYTCIARANTALEFIGNFDGFETSGLQNRLEGEAKFMRAFAYFELVKHFGGVPKIDVYVGSTDDQLVYPRSSVAEIYQLIESDLTSAASSLPVSYDSNADLGRATQGAALTLLAKASLYQGKYSEARQHTETVMGLGYSLEPNFADNWHLDNEFGVESIFEISYADGFFSDHFESANAVFNQGSSSFQMFGFIFNNAEGVPGNGGFGNCVPRQPLIDTYDDADTRKDATFITPETVFADIDSAKVGTNNYQYFWTNPDALESKASSRKYHLPAAVTTSILNMGASPLNEKILRYSDVLLMHAEASVMGAGGDGQGSLDLVRARAGLASIPLTLENVKAERRRELATEGWDRFTDLVRWGDAASALAFKNFQSGRDELLPIPQSEIDLVGSDVLNQNPGYN